MREKNTTPSSRTVAYICVLITLSLLLISAGCVNTPVEKSSEDPAPTCSVDAGVCQVVPAGFVRIDASPQEYSPVMSSTVGIGLTPDVSGLSTNDTQFEWNATYGYFLDWSTPDFKVNRLSEPVVSHGEKIFWSFTEVPPYPPVPVIITVTARNIQSQKVLGSSRMTLGWKGNFTVVVEKIE